MSKTDEVRDALDREFIAWRLDGNPGTHEWLTVVPCGSKQYEFFECDGKIYLTCEWDDALDVDVDGAVALLMHEMWGDE